MADFQGEISEKSRLVELLNALNSEEKAQILQCATLPMFNSDTLRAHVRPLLDICLSHTWHDPGQKLEKKKVFAALFPGQDFLDGKLEKIMVEAFKVVQSILTTQHYLRAGNEFNQNFDFSEIIRSKGLNTRYQQLLSRLQKLQAESPWENAPTFHRQFLLEFAVHEEESYHNQAKGDLNVPVALQALDRYYHFNRLALLNTLFLQQKITNLETPTTINHLLEETVVPEWYLAESPSISVNYSILASLRKKHPEPYDVRYLFDLLLVHENKFDPRSLREYYTYLRNICVLAVTNNPGFEEIYFTLHDLYKDNLERGYLHYEGKIHPSRYWAVSYNAVRVKKYEWALEFIERYKDEIIGENESRDIYRLNFANYLLGIGQYSECLDNIPATSPFVDYLLYGKRLELKALYELQSDLLSYRLDAYKMFLSRTSQKLLSGALRQINLDFANLLTQIIASRSGDKERAEYLTKRIEEKRQSAEWGWLLEKARALARGYHVG